jgi:hypothetical protein
VDTADLDTLLKELVNRGFCHQPEE